MTRILALLLLILVASCRDLPTIPKPPEEPEVLYLGADLSYVNEMEDCGGEFRSAGQLVDPIELFRDKGANIVRFRLWHSPSWTDYSNLVDVKKSISRAKTEGFSILLDFHYSDDWADPGSQEIPSAWSGASTKEELGQLLYDYTYDVLTELYLEDLLPDMVQVGNEINNGLLRWQGQTGIDWENTVYYLNQGFAAVSEVEDDTGEEIETMVHIAQPENADWWFPEAFSAGLGPFDWVGLSYYPVWSDVNLEDLSGRLENIKTQTNRDIMIVETAYPHSLNDVDNANNILGSNALVQGYPATPEGQKAFLVDLVEEVVSGKASGVIYWEPAWISTGCSTRWGQGSHWDNATFFDAENNNEALPAFDFLTR